MDRATKKHKVESLHGDLPSARLVLVVEPGNLSASQQTELRRRSRKAGANWRIIKNKLAALSVKGTPHEGLSDLFKGPRALAWSQDPLAAAKALVEFNKDFKGKLTMIGGSLDERRLTPSDINALASLPPLDTLRGKLIGLLQAPASKMVGVLQAPAGQVSRVLAARGRQ
ncbi:MAG: 50S ribosomal protein L10 [Alphaproteobacteria bacterium]|nr:MAG: 50S ribosomal protein L10 [Alphaproteobacteria bacterium]